MKTTDTDALRSRYRALRASTARLTPARFDFLARGIAEDNADGEAVTPKDWLVAAHILASGQDHP